MDFSTFLSSFSTSMKDEELSNGEIAFEFPPFLRVYKDGKAMRLLESESVPPSDQDPTGVSSKDVVIDPETGLSARIYLPKITTNEKLPLLVYFHGGGFCLETAFSPFYHGYLNSLVAEANVVAVSVDYRRAPDYPLPIAHEDSWFALKWVLSHSNIGDGVSENSWLNTHVDFNRVFLAGDSAGANIAHNMAIRVGTNSEDLSGVKEVLGVVMIHPYFGGVKPVGSEENDLVRKEMLDKLWLNICPSTTGLDDPLLNPANDPNLSRLGCKRILIFVAEMDMLRERGWFYYETLKEKKSEWNGEVEIRETEGEDHVFHLFNPAREKSKDLMKQFVTFLNQEICWLGPFPSPTRANSQPICKPTSLL